MKHAGAIGAVVAGSCAALVVWRAMSAPAPAAPANRADAAMRAEIAADVAAHEDEWRDKAASTFPSDNWSQSDDFHALESQRVRDLASQKGVTYEDVLRAIDDDLRRGGTKLGDARNARAVPCKPRPFYD